jgi:hypothetical protein
MTDAIMTLDEAAAFCKLHPQTLRRSQCPRSKLGGRILFERAVILQWVAAHRSHELAAVA